jgi:hypothetical protein
MEEKKVKKGKPYYRFLRIDYPPSEESKKAIEFMESLGVAYTLERIPRDIKPATKLPCVWLGNGAYFEGLQEIVEWRKEFDHLFPGEMDWLFSEEFLKREEEKARGYS